MQINDEGRRLLSNLATHYDAWIQARRIVADGHLRWKTSAGRDYLYRILDRTGNGTSLGPRSSETEAVLAAYESARLTVEQTGRQLDIEGKLYRTLRLPRVPSYAAKVLRQLDIDRLLGSAVLVVGTNALTAYAIEAGVLPPSDLDSTEDFDLSWVRTRPESEFSRTVFGSLKAVDDTYTINTERTFQARNADGNEIDLLAADEVFATLPKYEKLRPVPLPEQNWLLPGRRISHVVCGYDATPARVEVPDPRWFALHKLWLAEKPTRNPLKKSKDERQGYFVLDLTADHMSHFPLDAEFENALPAELKPYFDRWKRQRAGKPEAAQSPRF